MRKMCFVKVGSPLPPPPSFCDKQQGITWILTMRCFQDQRIQTRLSAATFAKPLIIS